MGSNKTNKEEFDISFKDKKIKVMIQSSPCITSEEENKKQIAKYLWKLAEINNNYIPYDNNV
ncbi:MAG: hypothetical protein IJY61_02390 [Candidatus Gastranaerophilales bacterium]|nr:hypothetical protein [Candidatus Gastranaerophilales bacterium]